MSQSHLDARREQILDAARDLFAARGFAHTSMPDIVEKSGLSVGAIYRYFTGKDEIVRAICEQGAQSLPGELTAPAIRAFLEEVQTLSKQRGHAQLVAQIYAEAAVSPDVAGIVRTQLDEVRARLAALVPERDAADARRMAVAFAALCQGYSLQMAVGVDVDVDAATAALLAASRL
ncbi:TetR/AcrR family transcriptional regulator [Frondihabitans sp. PAMC 28766]|uniref:TetR/AcrR family transcriptional regulator n=1 Tax=Frondihabitans sp. PAMC 28766 TaxID=1795630 RepID=UPI000A5DC2C4|nr:TetR/AcrR family transcriptional regulator [Frondihabitans sp. PAMC 28766]